MVARSGKQFRSRNVHLLTNVFQFSRKLKFSEVADQELSSSHHLPNAVIANEKTSSGTPECGDFARLEPAFLSADVNPPLFGYVL